MTSIDGNRIKLKGCNWDTVEIGYLEFGDTFGSDSYFQQVQLLCVQKWRSFFGLRYGRKRTCTTVCALCKQGESTPLEAQCVELVFLYTEIYSYTV